MSDDRPAGSPHGASTGEPSLGATAELLGRIRAGDESAVRELVDTYGPRLERWAHGRLPANARGLVETQDLVQISLMRVLRRIDDFDSRHPGAFLAYVRRALLNQLRNEIRDAGRRPQGNEIDHDHADRRPSALEQAVGREAMESYETALTSLRDDQQAAVIMRVELGCAYKEIAETLGCPSANAARMLVSRALDRLSRDMEPG